MQTLVRSLEVSEKLITEYKLEWQKKYDEITSDWLAAKCQAMCLKIRYGVYRKVKLGRPRTLRHYNRSF